MLIEDAIILAEQAINRLEKAKDLIQTVVDALLGEYINHENFIKYHSNKEDFII